MTGRLAIQRIRLDAGNTFAATTDEGVTLRVIDGRVWATTGGSLDDVWLKAGEEHHLRAPGLTVIESDGGGSTVELIAPLSAMRCSYPAAKWVQGSLSSIARAASGIAALAMTAVAISLMVVLPAKMMPDTPDVRALAASAVVSSMSVRE